MAWFPSKLIGVKKNNTKKLNKEKYPKGANEGNI
jgi:hypothetical protein